MLSETILYAKDPIRFLKYTFSNSKNKRLTCKTNTFLTPFKTLKLKMVLNGSSLYIPKHRNDVCNHSKS